MSYTNHTAALGLIATALHWVSREESVSQEPKLLIPSGLGPSPRSQLAKSAPGQGHRTSVALSFPQGL